MSVVRLHVALEEIEPAVTRRIEVPTSLRLDRLHLVLQAAMPWQNHHLYEFDAAGRRWGLPDPDYGPDYGDDETSPTAKATLADMLEAAGDAPMGYLYDFGDSWRHAITVEASLAPDPRHLYPQLIEVAGACPPEDVGGIWSVEPSSSWGASSSAMPSTCMYRCWSCQSSFRSRRTAPTSRVMLSSEGKMPTTSARRLISLFRRSSGLVECSLARWRVGKAV